MYHDLKLYPWYHGEGFTADEYVCGRYADEDYGWICCTFSDRIIAAKCGKFHFYGNEKSSFVQVFSVLYIIQKIHEKYPNLEIENIGEPDFVIRYVPDPEKKAVQYFKTAIVCVILFFGAAFTIMTFIEDVSVSKVFAALYTRVTGQTYTGVSALEICFCIGLAIGIMVFYNHVGHKKITDDPTPIQVAMRKYEQDVDTTYIETSSRKGKNYDV